MMINIRSPKVRYCNDTRPMAIDYSHNFRYSTITSQMEISPFRESEKETKDNKEQGLEITF